MFDKAITEIATAIRKDEKAYKIGQMIAAAHEHYARYFIGMDVEQEAHYVAIEVMQQQGFPVTEEMDYDAINEVSSKAERAYVRICDKYADIVEWNVPA